MRNLLLYDDGRSAGNQHKNLFEVGGRQDDAWGRGFCALWHRAQRSAAGAQEDEALGFEVSLVAEGHAFLIFGGQFFRHAGFQAAAR